MAFLLSHYLKSSVERYPQRPAIEWRDTVVSYAELDEESDRLVTLLRAAGIGPGSRVGLYLPKSHRTIISMLAVLKAGAAYVPVDPGAPPARAAFILGNCEVRGLISTCPKVTDLRDHLPGMPSLRIVVNADDGFCESGATFSTHAWTDVSRCARACVSDAVAVETDPAYLLYTSGSTGTPKGVILTHRNALTFVEWAVSAFDIRPEDRLSNHAPMHFDLSVFDVYAAIAAGACTVIVPDQVSPFPMELAAWIDAKRISVWYSVPSALTRLLLHGRLERFEYSHLRTVLFAGEVFPVKYLRGTMERFSRAEFANLYGPTETNVCTYYRVPRPLSPDVLDIPIGRACENTEVFAVTSDGRRAGPDEEGELYVRGPSVMPGYWGLPDRSVKVLVANPLQEAWHDTAYRTGDIVRTDARGDYIFLGRRDHMVKSRGYRIELGEIEQVLYQHDRVREAAVIALPDDEVGARLHAVVTLHEREELTVQELHAFCLKRLPVYMVPESFTFRSDLPKTSTGKTDRQMLVQSLARSSQESASL